MLARGDAQHHRARYPDPSLGVSPKRPRAWPAAAPRRRTFPG